MKQRRKKPVNALTPVAVRELKKPGRHADGNGLYHEIDRSGARQWILRIVVRGRWRDIGLGGAWNVSLGDARAVAAHMRRLARKRGNPVAVRRKAKTVVPTFKKAAEPFHAEALSGWKCEKHRVAWLTTMKTYAFPVLGIRRVDQIETADVLKELAPIWLTKAETARRFGLLP